MSQRWTPSQANTWYEQQPWLVGCNFIPSTAANQLEMWQPDTFDPETIERELGWAAMLGMNSVRVYLHDLLWEADAEGFLHRIDQFLDLAHHQGIRTLLVFFDDCWYDHPQIGPQPEPVPGVHNSRWVMSPGSVAIGDKREWPRLEAFVRGVIRRFASDQRVLMWDMYNEVGNRFMATMNAPLWRRLPHHTATYVRHVLRRSPSLDLMDAAFEWARAEHPEQPLTAPVYYPFPKINKAVLAQSDVVTFHNYEDTSHLKELISRLKGEGRPVICTEWLSRQEDSLVQTHLPLFRREQVGCYSWGLVNGKTQTIYSWQDTGNVDEPPDPWYHDLLHTDGTPYRAEEAELFRQMTNV